VLPFFTKVFRHVSQEYGCFAPDQPESFRLRHSTLFHKALNRIEDERLHADGSKVWEILGHFAQYQDVIYALGRDLPNKDECEDEIAWDSLKVQLVDDFQAEDLRSIGTTWGLDVHVQAHEAPKHGPFRDYHEIVKQRVESRGHDCPSKKEWLNTFPSLADWNTNDNRMPELQAEVKITLQLLR